MVKKAAGTIVFVHANGFPAGTYTMLFEAWRAKGWRVLAPAMLGHDPAYPVVSNWRPTRDELISFIEHESPTRPVHLVGHSLGGFASVLVACKRPDLVAGAVLLDSPLITGWRAHSVQMMKLTGLMKRLSPARLSGVRRYRWASAEEAQQHFAAKRLFARWQPRVLRDYVANGIVAAHDGDGVTLAFHRDVETRFYNALPHHIGTLIHRHPPRCVVSYVGGTQSAEMRQAGMAATLALVGDRVQWIEGSHLFPMEKPRETAAAVLRAIALS